MTGLVFLAKTTFFFLSDGTMNQKTFSLKFIKSIKLVLCLMSETPGAKRKLPQHRIYNCTLHEITHNLYLASVLLKKKKNSLQI